MTKNGFLAQKNTFGTLLSSATSQTWSDSFRKKTVHISLTASVSAKIKSQLSLSSSLDAK